MDGVGIAMKDANGNDGWSGDFDPYGRPMFNTVRVVGLTLRCKCGAKMEGPTVYARETLGRWMDRWRCPRRRWWNAWRHPDAYTLGER